MRFFLENRVQIAHAVSILYFSLVKVLTSISGASFLESAENAFANASFTFFEGVLLVNSPQLLLSLCYLAYNGLFTRLQAAREWALFSEKYQPLRVTDPQVRSRISNVT